MRGCSQDSNRKYCRRRKRLLTQRKWTTVDAGETGLAASKSTDKNKSISIDLFFFKWVNLDFAIYECPFPVTSGHRCRFFAREVSPKELRTRQPNKTITWQRSAPIAHTVSLTPARRRWIQRASDAIKRTLATSTRSPSGEVSAKLAQSARRRASHFVTECPWLLPRAS